VAGNIISIAMHIERVAVPMPEARHAKVKRAYPQAKGRRRRESERNQSKCRECENSADLFHDPAPENNENERLLTRRRAGEFHRLAHICGFALPLGAKAQERDQNKSKSSERRRN
jgi:hypothetical protein